MKTPNAKCRTSNAKFKRQPPNVKRQTPNVERQTPNGKRPMLNVKCKLQKATANDKLWKPNVKFCDKRQMATNVKRQNVTASFDDAPTYCWFLTTPLL